MSDALERLSRLVEDLPRQLAEAQQTAAEFATRQFVGQAADGSVTAEVSGANQLTGVRLSAVMARRMDNFTLGERIAEAINNALDAADGARDELAPTSVSEDELAGAEELFARRMAELDRTLDAVQARLRHLAE